MTLLSTLGVGVQNRLEEEPNTDSGFWNVQNEIYPTLVEAMNETCLIVGEPNIRSNTPFTPVLNQNIQSLPTGALCLLRVASANSTSIRKTTVWDLDRYNPGWENDTGTEIDYWAPVGLNQWLIHPKLTSPISVIVTYIQVPILTGRPYTGTESSPFQQEYDEMFEDYCAAWLRLKETDVEVQQGLASYNRFLSSAQEFSKYSERKSSLRFTKTFGAPAGITPVETR